MHLILVREETIPRIANLLAVDVSDQLSLEFALGAQMREYQKRSSYYVIELDTFAKQWTMMRNLPRHNHNDSDGIYANCPACETMYPEFTRVYPKSKVVGP